MKIGCIILFCMFMFQNINAANEPFHQRESREDVSSQERGAFYVLSLHGGGVRGAIIAEILKEIEAVQKKPICQIFDLIVGTSTGALLSLGLSLSGGLEDEVYSAGAAVSAYASESKKIFSSKKSSFPIFSFLKDEAYKYSTKNLEDVLSEKFHEKTMKDCKTKVAITAVDTEKKGAFCF